MSVTTHATLCSITSEQRPGLGGSKSRGRVGICGRCQQGRVVMRRFCLGREAGLGDSVWVGRRVGVGRFGRGQKGL